MAPLFVVARLRQSLVRGVVLRLYSADTLSMDTSHSRVEIIAPTHYNDGTAVESHALYVVESRLLDVAGGFSAYPGRGSWRDSHGTLYSEPHTRYVIDGCDTAAVDSLRMVAKYVARKLSQVCVYFAVDGVVEFVYARAIDGYERQEQLERIS